MYNFIDMHSDTISYLYKDKNIHLFKNSLMIDIERLKKSEYLLQCFAMFVPLYSKENKDNYSPFKVCNEMIDVYYKAIRENKDNISPIYSYVDIENNIKSNKLSSMLTIEEGGVLEGNIYNLDYFYSLGVRMMTLTWNFKNEIAYPNIDLNNRLDYPNTKDGLTLFGIEVVKKMNELGMIIDCSHIGDKSFYDVIKYSTKPIVCSHSCSRSIAKSFRNMTDDMLFKLKENGGVVGINFCHDFIKDDDSLATIKDIVKHISYIKNLIGVDYIGLGSDFDGISNSNIELKESSLMPMLVKELENQNYTKNEIDKITHLNVLRVFKKNLK